MVPHRTVLLSYTAALFVALSILSSVSEVLSAKSKRLNTFAGEYIAYGLRFPDCDTNEYNTSYSMVHFRVSHFNPTKPSELQRITGYMRTHAPLTDRESMHVNLATWSNNQWKQNAFNFNFPNAACSAVRSHIPNMYRLILKDKANETGPCVIPADNYEFNDDPIAWEFPNFPVMPYGHWLFTFKIGKRDVPIPAFCIMAEAKTIPKF